MNRLLQICRHIGETASRLIIGRTRFRPLYVLFIVAIIQYWCLFVILIWHKIALAIHHKNCRGGKNYLQKRQNGTSCRKNRGILKFKIAKKLIQSTWFAKIMGCQIFLTDVLQCVLQKKSNDYLFKCEKCGPKCQKMVFGLKKSMPWSFTISNANPLVTSRTLLLLFVGYD